MSGGSSHSSRASASPPRACEAVFGVNEEEMESRLKVVQSFVARPVPEVDPGPALVGDTIYIGSKYHAADVDMLVRLGVTGALNCASGGIRSLPLDLYATHGIQYGFTNVAQDSTSYPILHSRDGTRSEHLEVAVKFYNATREAGGKALFFCVAGQNRSATLAIAVLLLEGRPLEKILQEVAPSRPFILENIGFQRQLVELGALQEMDEESPVKKIRRVSSGIGLYIKCVDEASVMVELLVPGLRTFEVNIPEQASIDAVRSLFIQRVDDHLSRTGVTGVVGKAWLVFSMFGSGPEFDLILEEAAVEAPVQVARLHSTFGLEGCDERVRWTTKCRFELVIFSIAKPPDGRHEPFTFRHQEREGAQGTLLAESLIVPHLRAWDLVTGESYRSIRPIVFSFSENPTSKRDFMNISTKEGERQQFNMPGEGGILGMGNNAIVHQVELEATRPATDQVDDSSGEDSPTHQRLLRKHSFDDVPADKWDAAVKRPFSLPKMLAAIETKNEAGVAKRLRMAGALNRQGRLLYFYGLGIALSANNTNHEEFKFEAVLLSQFMQDFSSYTLKRFMDDYTAVVPHSEFPSEEQQRIKTLQGQFSLIKVKVLLVSLLNGFRDLTLMGVQAFDFNHLNNVLISRDYRKARLIDIDGVSKGSIQFPSNYIKGSSNDQLHKPALDIDLSTLLPLVVQQLMLGKGLGKPVVNEQVSLIRRAKSEEAAKAIIKSAIADNFFADTFHRQTSPGISTAKDKHLAKVVEWFYAMLMKRSPWTTWTNDIYDAMRCIDHLPVG